MKILIIIIAILIGIVVLKILRYVIKAYKISKCLISFNKTYDKIYKQGNSKKNALEKSMKKFRNYPLFTEISDREFNKFSELVSKTYKPKSIVNKIFLDLPLNRVVEVIKSEESLKKAVELQNKLSTEQIEILKNIKEELKYIRGEFCIGTTTLLMRNNVSLNNSNEINLENVKLNSILKAHQLSCVVGFSFNYVENNKQVLFEEKLVGLMCPDDKSIVKPYYEKYSDRQGDADELAKSVTNDIIKICNLIKSNKTISIISNYVHVVGIRSQSITAKLFGDKEEADELNNIIRLID